jgi:SAM-dependent methyltransferase
VTVTAASGESKQREIFFKIHRDLPREGPGDSASTQRAYRSIGELPPHGRILDVGCGPGIQTIDLASIFPGTITALDNHPPYLLRLDARARAAGLSRCIRLVQAWMFSMPFQKERFDVIWAEGAIYILGFDRALEEWRPLLRRGGYLAATHLSWLAADVPREPRAFWERTYPAIRHVDENAAACSEHGFELVEHFTLPESAWWTDYYGPMERRLAGLRDEYGEEDGEALAVIDASHEQIDVYRRFSRYYGYVFYVLRVR